MLQGRITSWTKQATALEPQKENNFSMRVSLNIYLAILTEILTENPALVAHLEALS